MSKRIKIFAGLIAVLSLGLSVRLGFLSMSENAVTALGDSRYSYSVTVQNMRGNIYDENLTPLLYRDDAAALFIDPQYFKEAGKGMKLAEYLGEDIEEVAKKISKRRPFIVKTYKEMPRIEGITCIPIKERYGEKPLAAHTIGYTDEAEEKGLAGLEKAFDKTLSCESKVEASYAGNAAAGSIPGLGISVLKEGEERPKGIKLTLNHEIQRITDEAADKLLPVGAVVVVDVETGGIAALSSRPTFNPQSVDKYLNSEKGELLNRCFLAYPLGSVFKTVVAACALEGGIDPYETNYCCEGNITVDGIQFNCHKEEGHGDLNLTQAFARSCNTYFINLCLSMGGAEAVLPMAEALGFGKGLHLYSNFSSSAGELIENTSFIPPALSANTAIGQGEMLATPLQVADMMTTVASGGVRKPLHLVSAIVNENMVETYQYKAGEPVRVMSEETAKKLKELLRTAVTEGSGAKADAPGVFAAGKTSSAEGVGDEIHGWFAGFFPSNSPKYAIAVFAENGRTGGGSCAPVFREIAKEITKSDRWGGLDKQYNAGKNKEEQPYW